MEKQQKITAKRVVWTSFLVDISDVLLNVFVVFITGSVVVLAEAFQGLADLLASFLLVIGVRRSKRVADRIHPYGYGRELYFWTLISGLIMFSITATASVYFGWKRLLNPQPVDNIILALAILAIGVATNGYSFTLSYRRLVGDRGIRHLWGIFMHSSVAETKTAMVLDLMGTLAALIGFVTLVIYHFTGDLRLDGLGAIIIGIMLGFLSIVLLRGTKELLVGASAQPEVEDQIKRIVKAVPEVTSVIGLNTVYIGPKKLLVNLEVNLKNGLTTDEIERITDIIQTRVKNKIPSVHDTQVELESPKV